MNQTLQFMPTILGMARAPGQSIEPINLTTCMREYENPLQALGGWDSGSVIFEALRSDIGFIHYRSMDVSLTDSERQQLIGVMRWLIQHLEGWRFEEDSGSHELGTLFVIAHYCGFDKSLWNLIPDTVGKNRDLLENLARMLAVGFRASFQAPSAMPEPVWERETVDLIMKADAEADWEAIDNFSVAFAHALSPNLFLTQLIHAICQFDFSRLVEASQHIRQVLTAIQIAEALELEERFVLGATTTSPWVRFACVYATFPRCRQAKESLSPRETQLLTSLLINVAEDSSKWHKWMAVFNRYPTRYPGLQEALGHALARVAEPAIQAYVTSIDLYAGRQEGRNTVASCLSQFRCVATLERRRCLWAMAYVRWAEWNFDVAKADRYLFEICWSELDYGVVGYVMEVMDQPTRTFEEREITNKLATLDHDWHGSISDCVSSWNRLLSRLQPFAHAAYCIKAGKDWLATSHYMLETFEADRYLKMMYSIR